MTVVVFLGPSLPLDEARRILPDAVYEPPVTQGDLVSAVLHHRANAVGIVDGRFDQVLSVWHREVLWALGRGVRVVGGASMGALRAAECDVLGMEGVGTIYGWYRDGIITGDDEVAVMHAEAAAGWRCLSLPMVNLRATVAAAQHADALTTTDAERLLTAAASLWYPERTERAVVAAAGLGAETLDVLRSYMVDQKAEDARAVLHALAHPAVTSGDGPEGGPAPSQGWEPPLGRALRHLDRWVQRRAGRVRLDEIVHQVLATRPDAEHLHRAAALRSIAVTEGERLGIEPGPDELDEARARLRRRAAITDDDDEVSWRAANDLDDHEFARMVRDEAVLLALQRFVVRSDPFLRGRHHLLDELRLAGIYPELADAAARQRAGLRSGQPVSLPDTPEERAAVAGAWAARTSPPGGPALRHWLEDLGYLDSLEAALVLAEGHEWQRRRALALQSLSGTGARPAGQAGQAPQDGAGAASVLRVLESFRPSLAAIALVRHGVLDELDERSWTPLPGDRLRRALLAAAASLGMVEYDSAGNAVRRTAGGTLLARGTPGSLAPWAEELRAHHLPAWMGLAGADAPSTLAGPPAIYGTLAGDDAARRRFDEALDSMTGAAFPELRWPFGLDWSAVRRVVDLGGGTGAVLGDILRRVPTATGWLVERPEVHRAARSQLDSVGLTERTTVLGPDEPLPPADRYLACRFLMNLADDDVGVWLARVAAVMPLGAELVVIEPVAGRSTGWAFADLNNLLLAGGAVRSLAAWRTLAAGAGLVVVRDAALSPALAVVTLALSG